MGARFSRYSIRLPSVSVFHGLIAGHGQSCDALCAKAEMACTHVAANHNPGPHCGDAISDTIAPFPVCRCCAVEQR